MREDAPPESAAPIPGPLRVLVVEDCRDSRDCLAALLRLYGCLVEAAADCDEALQAARANLPDVVLMDIGLPGCDGYAAAKQLRGLFPHKPLLIALTGYGQESIRQRSAEEGFDHHLVKPADPQGLVRLLRDHAARLGRG
jgi:CheY-like chemotaxis protein